MSFSASSSRSTHGGEGHLQGRKQDDSGVHYHYGASQRQSSRSRATESRHGSATSRNYRDVYRPFPHILQQEFQGPMPIAAENSGLVNEMIIELLQDPIATGNVGAISRLLKTST